MRFSRFIGNWGWQELYRVAKFSKKYLWISSRSLIHDPSSNFISEMQFLCLLMMVERWKNLELRPPSLTHSFLEICCNHRSSLASQSSSSRFREALVFKFSLEGTACWIKEILFWTSLIFSFVFPNFSLFHHKRSRQVTESFLASLRPWEPCTRVCQALSTTRLLPSSLVHIASKWNGWGHFPESKWVSSIIGLWSELELHRCLTPALGNKVGHSWSHRRWSNRSFMLTNPSLLLDHVNERPINMRLGEYRTTSIFIIISTLKVSSNYYYFFLGESYLK